MRYVSKLLIFLILETHASSLFAVTDCVSLFKLMEDHPNVPRRSSVEELSFIPSSYARFTLGASDINSSNSHVLLNNYKSTPPQNRVPYPVVNVEVSTNQKDLNAEAVVISTNRMIVVLDKNTDLNSINNFSYLGQALQFKEYKEYNGKKLFLLESSSKLELTDDSLDTSEDKQAIRELLSLYYVPRSGSGIFDFLYPPMQSVVFLTMTRIDGIKPGSSKDLFSKIWSQDDGDIRGLNLSNDPVINRIRQEIMVFLKYRVYKEAKNRAFGTFYNSEISEKESKNILSGIEKKFGIKPSEGFLELLSEIINSSALQHVYTSGVIPATVINSSDMSYQFEDFVKGFDAKIDKLISLVGLDKLEEVSHNISYYTGRVLGKSKLEEEIKIVLKKLIWQLGKDVCAVNQLRNSMSEEEVIKYYSSISKHITDSTCTGTVVSSNTIITATHCVEHHLGVSELIIKKGETEIKSIAYYTHPKYNLGAQDVSQYDIAIVRFPDHSFDDMVHAKIGLDSSIDSGISVGTEGQDNIRKIVLMTSLFEKGHGVYNSYKTTCEGDSGSPLFGEDNRIVGLLSCGTEEKPNVYCLVGEHEDFLTWVKEVDPKLEIKGLD